MARPVQLAPGSLALVLCRLEARGAADALEEPGGRAVFRAFRRANARCFWNAPLARAASRLAFQGWLRRAVLLVRAPPACLQVLRDAWRRRALRPPRGFRIRAVGDVFPVQMNPIAQSQSMPLAEVLCCAISDMNTAQIRVTQDLLLEHLKKHYPGITIPSQDILYTTLGALIKDRKIYHTGEGYFIVTPQTYFITDLTFQENRRAVLPGRSHPLPASETWLVNTDTCIEGVNKEATPSPHCRSCQCFSDLCLQDVEEPPLAAEVTRKDQKGFGESMSLVQNRAVSASEENHICESPRTLPLTKDKDKGKKFGFSLFWRSISRKEKPKMEYCSFSAQFPPEEWPVRDEDNLDNIPRDVEHEIIKRINPVLTVDNLIKHTVLMQKYEEQRKYNSQGTSTDMPTARHTKCPSKEAVKKRQGRSAKPRRRDHSHRARHRARSQGPEHQPASIRPEKHPKLPAAQLDPQDKGPDEGESRPLLDKNSVVHGAQLIYKKRISNPFQGLSLRRSPITKGHNIQKTGSWMPHQAGPREKPFQRSRSSDSSRILGREAQKPYADQCHDQLKAEPMQVTNPPVQPVKDDFRDGPLKYPQGSDLRGDSHCCSVRESMLPYDMHGVENKVVTEILKKSQSQLDTLGETKETLHVLPSSGASSLEPTSSACRLVDKTIHQLQTLGLVDFPVGVNHLRQPERRDREAEELMGKEFVQEAQPASVEHEELSDEDQASCQEEAGEDGACSSLYLEDDDFSEDEDLCRVQPGHDPYFFADGSQWNRLGKPTVTDRSQVESNNRMVPLQPKMLQSSECYKPTGLLTNPGESHSSNLSAENCGLNSGSQFGFNYEENVAECVQTSASADGILFDYYGTKKPSSKGEIPQDAAGDTGKKPARWNQSPQHQEMTKPFTQKLEFFNTSHVPVLTQDLQHEHGHLEGTENHSMAGDSGIDSPRTQSLTSNNSVILDGLKRRRNFLQNVEGAKSSQAFISNSLLQLTPVINV